MAASRTLYRTPGDLARKIFKGTVQTPALRLIDQALLDVQSGVSPRLILSKPPQEGKSERISRFTPTWMLLHNPELKIASISAADTLARRWGKQVRNDIWMNKDLGLKIMSDSAASNEWQLEGHRGGMITSSIGGILTGRPVDVMIIDDPHKDMKDADSEIMRGNVQEWWRGVGSTRLPPGGKVILVQTRWHEEDLAGWLQLQSDGWRVVNIPAQADHRPERGEVDLLGRQPGEYMISARGRDVANWEERKADAGPRVWGALFQGRPSPADGGVFKRSWWQHYHLPRAIEQADGTWLALGAEQVIQSWDMAFKDTDGSDYVCGQVWARKGALVWLLDQVWDRLDFPDTCAAVVALSAKWPQATAKIIEDKANGPAVIAQLRQKIPGLIAYTPLGSKLARAHAVSPFVHAGGVALPDITSNPYVEGIIAECSAFPNGAHDDRVDALTQALNHLLLSGTQAGDFMRELMALGGGNEAGEAIAAQSPMMGRPDPADAPEMVPFEEIFTQYAELDLPPGVARSTMSAHETGAADGDEDW